MCTVEDGGRGPKPDPTFSPGPNPNQVSMVEVAVGGDSDGSCLLILLAAAVLLVAFFNAATLGCKDICRVYGVGWARTFAVPVPREHDKHWRHMVMCKCRRVTPYYLLLLLTAYHLLH